MKRLIIIVAVVSLLLLAAVVAFTQAPGRAGRRGDPAQRWQHMLERWDANKDGKLSKDEFQGRAEMFTRLDADGDGVVTKQEFTEAQQAFGAGPGQGRRGDPAQRWQQMLERWDANKDGKLSKDEFQGPDEMFARLDADGNGALTQEEAAAAGPGGGQGQRMNPGALLVRMLDEDADGRISEAEWGAFFTKADANGDGFLTHDELTEQMRQAAPPRGPAAEAGAEGAAEGGQ